MIILAHVTQIELPWGLAWYALGIASGILISHLGRYWLSHRQRVVCQAKQS